MFLVYLFVVFLAILGAVHAEDDYYEVYSHMSFILHLNSCFQFKLLGVGMDADSGEIKKSVPLHQLFDNWILSFLLQSVPKVVLEGNIASRIVNIISIIILI